MMSLDTGHARPMFVAPSVSKPRHLRAKEVLHEAGDWGKTWRVVSGALRLDQVDAQGRRFAGLALTGDLVGAEMYALGRYAFGAQALVPATVMPWPPGGGQPPELVVLHTFVQQQQRTAELLSLRSGSADERVIRLIELLAGPVVAGEGSGHSARVVLPILKDMAELTDLTIESISRSVTKMRQCGVLVDTVDKRRHYQFQRARLNVKETG